MSQEHLDQHSKEAELLQAEKAKAPELFFSEPFIENNQNLSPFGISIPDKEHLPLGFLKLRPEDFIVEEIGLEQDQTDILHKNTSFEESFLKTNETVYATLVKCGLSTVEIVQAISKKIETDPKNIGFAGIKDKNAITSQRISIRKTSLSNIKNLASPYYFLKDFTIGKGSVGKAALSGNRFTILVRTPELSDATFQAFEESLKRVETEGFWNYFYLQRFGTPRLCNYEWGLDILRGEYEKAVYGVITRPGVCELPYFKKLRRESEPLFGNWTMLRQYFESYPIFFRHELKLIHHLEENPADFVGALNTMPDQITLWVYALASIFFNKKIAFCIENEKNLPNKIPLFLSRLEKDWGFYRNQLNALKLSPPPFENLRPFPYLVPMHREVPTKDRAIIHGYKRLPEGIAISFTLGKGSYATTFLSHLFNLVSSTKPDWVKNAPLDFYEALHGQSPTDTLTYFRPITDALTQNALGEE